MEKPLKKTIDVSLHPNGPGGSEPMYANESLDHVTIEGHTSYRLTTGGVNLI